MSDIFDPGGNLALNSALGGGAGARTRKPIHGQITLRGSRYPLGKVTLRGIKTQFGRFSMTILAVLVGTAFLTSVLGLREVLNSLFTSATSASVVYDLYVMGPENETAGIASYGEVQADLADEIAAIDGVSAAQPYYQGSVLLYDEQGNLQATSAMTVVTANFAGSSGPTWTQGSAPTQANQVAVEEGAASRLDLQVGDSILMLVGDTQDTFQVTGIFAFDVSPSAVTYFSVAPAVAEAAFGGTGTVSYIQVNGPAGASATEVDDLAAAIASQLGDQVTVMTAQEYSDYLQEQMDLVLGFVTTFLLVFTAIALFVATFIIYNTFQMSVRARQREFAMLRAIGTAPRQIFWIVAVQAVFIGLVGGALGIVGGLGLNQLTGVVFQVMGIPLDEAVPFTAQMVAASLIVGVAVTLVSALIPARTAARTAPVEAMRAADVSGAERSLTGRTVIGIVMLALGIAAITVGALRLVSWSGWALGLGALLVVVGVLVLSPVLVRPVAAAICGILRPVARTSSRLAARNIGRNPRRMSVTSGALIVCIALVAAGATLASSVKSNVQGVIEDSLLADLAVTSLTTAPVPTYLAEQIGDLDGVARVDDELASGTVSYVDAEGEATLTLAAALNPDYVGTDLSLNVREGNGNPLAEGQVAILSSFASQTGLQVGDSIEITATSLPADQADLAETDGEGVAADSDGNAPQTRTYTIGAIVELSVVTAMIYLPYDQVDLLQNPSDPVGLFVQVEADADVETVKTDIQDAVRHLGYMSVGDKDDFASEMAANINQVLIAMYALLGLSLVVAAIGIVNTLTLSVSERTREFGLLRAVGFSRGGVGAMIVVESVVTTVFGALLGIATGIGLSAALCRYLQEAGLSAFSIPWGILGLTLLGGIILGAIAAIVPAGRAARVPVLEAIASE